MNSQALKYKAAYQQWVRVLILCDQRNTDMKSIKLIAASVLLFGSATLAVPGFAGDKSDRAGWGYHGSGHGHGGKRMEKILDLTDAQKETLKAQRETQKDARAALQDKISEAREALSTAVEAGANDAELAALTETLGKLHADQLLAGAKAHKAFIAVLTDAQKQKLVDLKNKREARRNARESLQAKSSVTTGT